MTAYLLQQLLVASITIAVAIGVALLLRALSPRDSVLRYRVLLAFLPLILLILPLQIAGTEILDTPRSAAIIQFIDAPPPGSVAYSASSPFTSGSDLGATTPVAPASFTMIRAFSPWNALLPVYFAGVAITGGWIVARAFRASRLIRRATPATDPCLLALWADVWRAHSTSSPPRVLQSSEIPAPAVAGVLRPLMLIPSDDSRLRESDSTTLVMSHEALHVCRRDPLVHLGQLVTGAIFWFHPLVWRYCRLLEQERESSCDALVVRSTGRARSYAMALLSYCTTSTPDRASFALAPALSHFGRGSKAAILRRIDMLGYPIASTASKRLVRAASALGLIAAIGGTVGLAAACGPEARSHKDEVTVAAPPIENSALLASRARDATWPSTDPLSPSETRTPRGIRARANPFDDRNALVATLYRADEPARPIGTAKRAVIHAPPGPRLPETGTHLSLMLHLFARQADVAANEGERTFTDQESIVSTPAADKVSEKSMTASEFSLSLPEGSNLRAEIDGEQIRTEQSGSKVVLAITKGQIRIVDKEGVSRAIVKPIHISGADGELQLVPKIENDTLTINTQVSKLSTQTGELLIAEVSTENGEINLRVRNGLPADTSRVQADLDLASGAPKDERQPPHGSVRYALNQRGPGGAAVVKMQFHYDAAKLKEEQSKAAPEKGRQPAAGGDAAR